MQYRWRCNACLRDFDEDVKVTEYDKFKEEAHHCPLCGKLSHFERIIEFDGAIGATGGYDTVAGTAKWQQG